ncbi:hypothetical protein KGMB01110_05400 [Mediterraneibacter butyricigenes]|uniref:Uncharacterized protein n=1 Tax=Mediterraneibacter butyricigenes TaxID=2316025 RepID=A0A391NXL7_9FIRM|nr:hypothetical protein [Mediterraneibacter butyricigenes]GCA66104.1 hypothetical protein KGMB01110_05400 [Mediterraneibacter butyricigenes]
MLNENRVKLMTRMAAYEEKKGKEDIPISSYYRKDYVGLNVLITILWTTIGYGLFLGLVLIGGMDNFLESLTITKMIILALIIVVGYFGSDCLCDQSGKFLPEKI